MMRVTFELPNEQKEGTKNKKGLAILKLLSQKHEGQQPTDPSQTDDFLRLGREGEMYGYSSEQ